MAMTYATCSVKQPTAQLITSCIQDCEQSFQSKYWKKLRPQLNVKADLSYGWENQDEEIRKSVHNICNDWRKNEENPKTNSKYSNVFLLTIISLVGIAIAAKLLSSKKQETKDNSPNPTSSAKPTPRQETHKISQPTNIMALFGLMAKS